MISYYMLRYIIILLCFAWSVRPEAGPAAGILSVLIISICEISDSGSQIPEPLLTFTSK